MFLNTMTISAFRYSGAVNIILVLSVYQIHHLNSAVRQIKEAKAAWEMIVNFENLALKY